MFSNKASNFPNVAEQPELKVGEDFENKNRRLKRPLSAHLSIHKLQNNMIISMTHRFTGVILCGIPFGLATGKVPYSVISCLMLFILDFKIFNLLYSGYLTAGILSVLFGNIGKHESQQVYDHDWKISCSLAIFISLFEWNPTSYLGFGILVNN